MNIMKNSGSTEEEEEVSISPLCLQRLVTEAEIKMMRELREKGLSIPKIARIVKRSPRTVSYYLRHNLDEGRMGLKKRMDQREICRYCRNLHVIGTGSQIILICTVTKHFKNYEDPCDCGCFQRKELSSG